MSEHKMDKVSSRINYSGDSRTKTKKQVSKSLRKAKIEELSKDSRILNGIWQKMRLLQSVYTKHQSSLGPAESSA